MNYYTFFHRIIRGQKFTSAESAIFYSSTRIYNYLKKKSAINIGYFTHIRGELLIFAHGGKITIGDYCYIGEGSRIWSGTAILIGDRTLISHNVNIFDNLIHPISAPERHEHFKNIITKGHPRDIHLDDRPVIIGNDVLVGAQSIILKGTTIGDNAIIGAGSVVTKDIPSFAVAAGNPARIVRMLAKNEGIE